MTLEEKLLERIRYKGIAITVIAERTGIPYMTLYRSLRQKDRKRRLRGHELLDICEFIGVDPMDLEEK